LALQHHAALGRGATDGRRLAVGTALQCLAAPISAGGGRRPTSKGAARSKQEKGGEDGARTHSTPATAPSGGGGSRGRGG